MSDFDTRWYLEEEDEGQAWSICEPTAPFKDVPSIHARVRTARAVAWVYKREDAQRIVDAVNKAKGEA
jgi:hypothetical protein